MPYSLRSVRTLAAASFATSLLICLATPAGVARADEAPKLAPRNTITTNPVRYALLHFQVEYERAVASRWSAFVAPIGFYHDTWYPFAKAPETTARGFGADFGGRYYFGAAPAGFFVGPYLSLYRGEVFHANVKTLEGWVFSAGAQGGYQYLVGSWVLSAGVGYSWGFPSAEAPEGSPKAAQLPHADGWVSFRANVGLAF